MRKKILIFHPALAPYRVNFFNMINDLFDASFYFNLLNVSDQKFNQEVLQKKCKFKSNYLLTGFELFGRSFRSGIIPIIKKENPDIILCSEYGQVTVTVFLFKYFFRKKFKLYTLSDDSINNSKLRKGFRSLLRKIIPKNIDGVIFPSIEVCNWYKNNISSKAKTLELPIIHEDELFRNELFMSLDTANKNIRLYNLLNKKILLFVGRLVEVKNLPFLFKVVANLKSLDWALIVVGDGVLMNELTTLSKKLNIADKTYFIGRKEGNELLSWYTFAHIFILPSTNEQFGAVVNEALLGGCTVLCSQFAGASSLINETNGSVFDPYNEQDLLECLEETLSNIKPLEKFIDELRVSKMRFTFKTKMETLFDML